MPREVLSGGAVRLSAGDGVFVFERVRPGVLAAAVTGRDTGEFGTGPFDILEKEHVYFQRRVDLFLDTTRAQQPAGDVAAQWTSWLRSHRDKLGRMHVLASSEHVQLKVNVAGHFSGAGDRLVVHTERDEWLKALEAAAGGANPLPAPDLRFSEPAAAVERKRTNESITLTAPNSTWTFTRVDVHIMLSRFTGDDSGELTNAAFDELGDFVAAAPRSVRWFIDARAGRNVAPAVSQAWTEWLGARAERFAGITALSTAPLFPLVLTVAKYRSGTDRLFRICREEEAFRRTLSAATSAQVAAAWVQAGVS